MMKTMAIIGGGISGLVAAKQLQEHFEVSVFEKARGVGGRMATRRADELQFDHGAQFFTARSDEFKAFLAPFIKDGIVREWTPKIVTLRKDKKPFKRDWFEPHYVAVPGMNSLCKALAPALNISIQTQIKTAQKTDKGWLLHDQNEHIHGPFDQLISSIPAPQTPPLFVDEHDCFDKIRNIEMTGCYTIMIAPKTRQRLNWDIAMPQDDMIEWIAVNSSKPQRGAAQTIVVNTSNEWAEAHIDDDIPAAQNIILEQLASIAGIQITEGDHVQTHRWRYAKTTSGASQPCFYDAQNQFGICGDWCLDGHVESAFLSAHALVKNIQGERSKVASL